MTFNIKKTQNYVPGINGVKTKGLNGSLKVISTPQGGGGGLILDGLVLHLDATDPASYPGTGTTWYDLSPSGEDATLVGSPTWDAAGYFTDFTDTNYITMQGDPYSVLPLGSSSRTIMAAVKTPDSLPIFWFGNAPGSVFVYGWTALSGGGCSLSINTSSNLINLENGVNSRSTGTVSADTFHVFGMKYDDAASPKHTFTIDGVVDTTVDDNSMNTQANYDSQYSPRIGLTSNGVPWNNDGRIYVILIYNRALSDAEMQQVSTYLTSKMS